MDRREFLLMTLAVAAQGCRSVPPLANTSESPDALARAVLDGLASNDRGSLEALAVNEREFRDHVWPDLPSARPERNLPFSYVWGDLRQKSGLSLTKTLATYGGKRYRLERVAFAGTTGYGHYRVHRDATFHVLDAAGASAALRVCGSFLEQDGVWKVFSYVVDD
jgi:hypothetical protein